MPVAQSTSPQLFRSLLNLSPKSGAPTRADMRPVALWLSFVALLVFAMIIVGGATRLTDSGLSITEWQPLLGAIPPLSDADWQAAFAKYKTIPQYAALSYVMTLDAFKTIFLWEWAHRFLGRFVGVVFAVPLVIFWATGRLDRSLALKLVGILALGGLQGLIGWYMVKSGLVDRIDVSQYRLALHLSVAFLILGCLVWLILDLDQRQRAPTLHTLTSLDWWLAPLLALAIYTQVAMGGFVAGLKAGRAYNTWPLMDGQLIPDGIGRLSPWWLNLSENMTTVQFDHRLAAYLIVALAIWHALRITRRSDDATVSASARWLAVGVVAQAALGIATVLWAVPISLGIAHQALAAIVFSIAIWNTYAVTRNTSQMFRSPRSMG